MRGIYRISRIGSDDCYIGQSANIKRRWAVHRNDLKNNRHSSKYLQRVYNKHGLSILSFEILELVVGDQDALNNAEQKWIDQFRPCFNSAPVSGSCLGFRHSTKTKDKHRKRMLGNKLREGKSGSFTGLRHSDETKQRIAAAKRGQPTGRKGFTHSQDTIAKISASKRGVPSPKKGVPSGKKGVPWTLARRAAHEHRNSEGRLDG